MLAGVAEKCRVVEVWADRGGNVEGGATGSAVVIGELDAVDVGFDNGWAEAAEHFGDFGCADIFGFPAERVAESVDW